MVQRSGRVAPAAALAVVIGLAPAAASAQSQWVSLGLEKHQVNCLLVDGAGRILAGADDGLYVRYDTTWLRLSGVSLPVTALAYAGVGRVLAAIGDGASRSDGVYLAEDILDGPPFYAMRVAAWVRGPTALAVRPYGAGPQPVADVFVGAGSGVYSGTLRGDTLEVAALVLPPYCFGVEQPVCRALHVFSTDGRCYAGGYDASPMPGPGSLVVEAAGDSMVTFRPRTNVSAIAERLTTSTGHPQLVVATVDSGLLLLHTDVGDTTPWWVQVSAPSMQPVLHVCPVPAMAAEEDGLLYVAVPGGIYRQCLSIQNCIWAEIGDIPAAPLFVVHASAQSPLYAASDNGVYAWRDASATRGTTASTTRRRVAPGPADAVAFDVRGRRAGGEYPDLTVARGILLVRAAAGHDAFRVVLRVGR